MSGKWWYAAALGTALGASGTTFMLTFEAGTLADPVSDAAVLAFLLGTLLVPVGILLDIRGLDAGVPWRPSGWRWGLASLVPILNLSAGVAYCVHRLAAARGTVPDGRWRYLVGAGAVAWTIAFAIEVAVDYVSLPVVDPYLFDLLLVVGLFIAPVAVYLDVAHVRGYTEWTPRGAVWAVGAGVPYLGALVCAGFLIRRRRAFADAGDPEMLSLPDGEETTVRPSSPWFRGAVGLFAVHFLAVVALAAGTSASGSTIEFATLLLWFPFGPFFAGCVFMDARWRRTRDRDVGDNWYLYLLSVVVQAAAFWYLLRRATKETGTPSDPVADTESG